VNVQIGNKMNILYIYSILFNKIYNNDKRARIIFACIIWLLFCLYVDDARDT